MSKNIKAILISLLALSLTVLVFFAMKSFTGADDSAGDPDANSISLITTNGYLSSAHEGYSGSGDTFLLCGTGGRLDRVYADGRIERIPTQIEADLTSVLVGSDITLVSGASGVLLYSRDGVEFTQSKKATKSHILGLAAFNGKYYACTLDGEILVSDDGTSWKKQKSLSEKAIISIASNVEYMIAITAETDIFISQDGIDWESSNFNDDYDGYYPKYVFTNLINLGPSFFLLGYSQEEPDYPIIMFTDSAGEVWMFKPLSEIDKKPPEEFFPLKVNYIGVFNGQLMAVCNSGRLLTITECSTCNTISDISGANLYTLALSEETLVVAGENFEFAVLQSSDLLDDTISPDQALTDQQVGAYIIDVRTEEEYNEKHIKGSIHIPVDEISWRLPVDIPDLESELIFYCTAGVRSQTALETALELGYFYVFNLGKLDDWPFETESGPDGYEQY